MPGRCHRCNKVVYAAEERRALGQSWHARCYSCAACGINLDSMRLEEHRELDDIYCNGCYRRLFATVCYGQARQMFMASRVCNCCGDIHHRSSFCPNGILLEKEYAYGSNKNCGDNARISQSKEKYD